jgi:hypothetical protein
VASGGPEEPWGLRVGGWDLQLGGMLIEGGWRGRVYTPAPIPNENKIIAGDSTTFSRRIPRRPVQKLPSVIRATFPEAAREACR